MTISIIRKNLSTRIFLAAIIILSASLFLISCNQQAAQAPSADKHEGSTAKDSEAKVEKKKAVVADGPTETVTLEVSGMTCDGCVNTVTNSLQSLDGVQEATVTLEPPQAIVKYSPGKVTVDQMNAGVKDKGYESKIKVKE
jgi:copper chaperone